MKEPFGGQNSSDRTSDRCQRFCADVHTCIAHKNVCALINQKLSQQFCRSRQRGPDDATLRGLFHCFFQTALVIANQIWAFFISGKDDMKQVSGVAPLLSVPDRVQSGETMSDPDHIYVDRGMCGGQVDLAEAGGAVRCVENTFRSYASGVALSEQLTQVSVDASIAVDARSSAKVGALQGANVSSELFCQCDDQLGGCQNLCRCGNFEGWQSSAPETGHTVSEPSKAPSSETTMAPSALGSRSA